MNRPSLANLETLCWIARLGTFAAAAQRMNITQPAISNRMRDLERSLKVKLFRRQGRKMELTIMGRELVQRAEPLLNQFSAMLSPHDLSATTGTIRMGVGEMVTGTWFADFIAKLRKQMPRVNYEISVALTADMCQSVESGKLDLAFVALPSNNPRLTFEYVGSAHIRWFIARALVKQWPRHKLTTKQLFEKYPIWCVAQPAHAHGLAMEAFRHHGIASKNINTSDNMQSIVEVVRKGAGIALLPTNLKALTSNRGELVPLSDDLPPERLDFAVATHRDQDQPIVKYIVSTAVSTSTFPMTHTPSAARAQKI